MKTKQASLGSPHDEFWASARVRGNTVKIVKSPISSYTEEAQAAMRKALELEMQEEKLSTVNASTNGVKEK